MAGFMLPFLGGLLIYYLSGYIIKDSPAMAKEEADINPQFKRQIQVVSPFTDVHFVELRGQMRPKHSTINQLMLHISFHIREKIHMNDLFTGYVVVAEFVNRLENEFESEKLCKGTLRRTYPKGNFTMEQREHPQFKEYLELLIKIDLWNYYCNKYPDALLYHAVIGANSIENEHLR